MKPADIGNWSLLQVFQEGGRLLCQEFRKLWPCIVVVILPASLTTVMVAQFAAYLPPLVYIQGSRHREDSKIDYVYLIFSTLFLMSPHILIIISIAWMSVTLTNTIYSDEVVETTRHVETENPTLMTTKTKRSGLPRTSKEKKLKTLAVYIVLLLLYYLGKVIGDHFTPEKVATMGLPPQMVFVFTLLITVLVTVFYSYLLLMYLTLFTWLFSPSLEERDKSSKLKDSSCSLVQSKKEV